MLDKRQRENCGRIFGNLLQVIFVGVVLAKLISPEFIPRWVFITGILACAVLFVLVLVIDKEVKQ